VTTLLRRTWERDGSYEVRAAALAALARSDSAGRSALIRTGLATPSYQSSIRNAAFRALGQYPDAVPPAELEPLIGSERLAVYALAAMAARGSEAAGAALMRHLDDDRGWVRDWTLGAIRNGMPTEQALARLRDAAGGLRHQDTKAAVTKAIEAMSRPAQ
jgi:HEAT repeat protein